MSERKEMFSEKEKYETTILSLDNKIDLLNKDNLQLKNRLVLLEKCKEKSKTFNINLIKKDKYIHKLKESIKKDYLEFNQDIIPESYLRISRKFPHLNLQEIILFEKQIRENGGSIQVHNGRYRWTDRPGTDEQNLNKLCSTPTLCRYGNGLRGGEKIIMMSWDCCHTKISYTNNPYNEHGCHSSSNISSNKYNILRTIQVSPDIQNPKPDGVCDFPETFYLREEDEKTQDIKKVTVEDVSLSIGHNIKTLEETIEKYSSKILKLKSLQQTLDLLTTD